MKQDRPCQPSYPHTHLSRSQIFEPNRSRIVILSCLFDSFHLKILEEMTFKLLIFSERVEKKMCLIRILFTNLQNG